MATMLLNPVISKLSGKLVVLASASPRRLEILSNVGLRFEVVPSRFKENLDKGVFKAPHEYAVETAKQKALEVARRMLSCHRKTPDIVIGADTIVTIDGVILEKPADKQDAYRMLSRLSGKEHSVFTGVAIVLCREKENEVDCQVVDFHEETKVKFADLSEDMLWEYISSGEPMDKAGGYGIQALGGMLVEYVHGDFLNVVGFPLNHFCKQLDRLFNHSTPSLDGEGLSVCATNSDPPVQFTQSSSSSVKHDPSRLPESPSTNQIKSSEENHLVNSVHEVKRRCREMEAVKSSGTVANNASNHAEDGEAASRGPEMTASPQKTRVGRVNELKATEEGDGEPRKEDLQRIIEMLDGFKASKTLFTASKMCVFDVLQSRPGLDAAQVAQEIKASVKGTERLLEACVSLGLLKSSGRKFENTDLAGTFLLSDSPFSLQCYIQYCDTRLWPLYSHLESAVLEGTGQHGKAFSKTPADTVQASPSNSQEARLRFMKAMHSYAKVTGKAVATAFDLSSFRTACDLGGCTGAIAYEITKAHPELSVTVFDLPGVVEMSGQFCPLHSGDRVTFVAGDFFEDDLPKADLYILARILHDWPDDKVHILLSRISAVCSPGCGILLSEIFLDEDRGGPSRGLFQALSMTEGKQRSATEYGLILKSHGFTPAHVTHTGNFLDAMLCIKA